jgi:tetratricopeptide (TPR) repeat protein
LPNASQFHKPSLPGGGPGDWNHGWTRHPGSWNYEHNWWHDHGHNWNGWWTVGIGWPWFGVGWWPGYYNNYYDYGYGVPYYTTGAYADYSPEAVPYTAAYPPAEATAAAAPESGSDEEGYYAQALAAFQQGDYRNATRLAGHASIDDPRNAKVHLLLMQGLFALGEYRGAAMEAHAVVALGKVPDWATIYAFYDNVDPYTEQLRKLEKSVRDNPTAAEGRFLLGFQYLVAGHKDAAKDEFLQALKLTPKDRVAANLLTQSGGTIPADIAKQLAPPAPPPVNANPTK